MGEAIAIISDELITREALQDFIGSFGGTPTDEGRIQGYVNRKDQWIEIFVYPAKEEFQDEDTLKVLKPLGIEPKTVILVKIGEAEGSDRLAVGFVLEFAKHWKIALDNLKGKLYSAQDLLILYNDDQVSQIIQNL